MKAKMDRKEKLRENYKKFYQANREQQKERKKIYYENNKDKCKATRKIYYENSKDKIKEYNKTEQGKKINRISTWKSYGIINDDFDALYEYYINCNNCEECGIELIEGIYGSNKRCLDHDHETGLFRNVLCNTCNLRRH
jgi:hypothetical protein